MGRNTRWTTNDYKKFKARTLDKKITQAWKPKKSELTSDQKLFIKLCTIEGLPPPIPEYLFAVNTIGRRWRTDYYFEKDGIRIALEVEGGVFNQVNKTTESNKGRHSNSIAGYLNDMIKYNAYSTHGIYLIRCIPSKLKTLETINLIKLILNQKYFEKKVEKNETKQ